VGLNIDRCIKVPLFWLAIKPGIKMENEMKKNGGGSTRKHRKGKQAADFYGVCN